jgi:hypothetical protein
MVEKRNTERDDVEPPLKDEDCAEEKHQPRWIQRYLDLADLLMRRRREKRDDDKAA